MAMNGEGLFPDKHKQEAAVKKALSEMSPQELSKLKLEVLKRVEPFWKLFSDFESTCRKDIRAWEKGSFVERRMRLLRDEIILNQTEKDMPYWVE